MNLPARFAFSLRWRVTAFLACAALVNYADRAALSSVLPSLRHELGLSDVQLGLLSSLFLWSYALGSPLAGMLADRVSRARIIFWSLATWSLVTAFMGFASNFAVLAGLRIALGLAECLYVPAAIALLADHHSGATRGRAMSVHSIGLNLGVVVGGAFAGFAADAYGWRSGFWMLGFAGIALAASSRYGLQDGPAALAHRATRAHPREALHYLLRTPSYFVMLAKAILSGITIWIFLAWLPLYFRERFDLSLGSAGFVGTFMLQFSTVLGIALGGWISDVWAASGGARRMLIQGLAYLAAAPVLIVFLVQPSLVMAALTVAGFSCLRGIGAASEQPTVCEVVPPRYRSTAVGFMNTCATAAGGGGVLVAGWLKGVVGLEVVFASSAGIFTVAAIVLLLGYRYSMPADIARAQAVDHTSVVA